MHATRSLLRISRHALRACAAVAVAAKLLVPVGYMPGPLAGGLPVQLCDAGFAPVVHQHGHAANGGHAHHDHAQHDQASELHWKYCPSGALAAAGAISVEYRLDLLPVEHERLSLHDARSVTRAP